MTQRFRTALVAVAALAVATVAIWLVLGRGDGSSGGSGEGIGARGGAGGGDGDGDDGIRLRPPTGPDGGRPDPLSVSVGSDGSVIGLRDPSGPDYSDPAQNQAAVSRLLGDRPIPWGEIARLLAAYDGQLDEDVRKALLHAIQLGDRAGALRAFAAVRDGTLTRDLLQMLDLSDLTPGARSAILQALGRMPGANDAEVVRGLESRLTGIGRKDLQVLQAIGMRGGKDGARAIVEYLLRADAPMDLPNYGYLGLDLAADAVAAQIVAEGLATASTPEALRALIRLSAQAGADGLVASLIALDHADQAPEVRREALDALGRIGTQSAVNRLLQLSFQPGVYGEVALANVGRIRSATVEARAQMVEALDRVDSHPNPDQARAALLRGLGNLGEPAALGAMTAGLSSRDPGVLHASIRGLGNIGEPARGQVESLVDLFAAGDESVQTWVASALGGVGGDDARSALQQMMSSDELPASVRRTARMAMQRLRDGATDAPVGGTNLGGR